MKVAIDFGFGNVKVATEEKLFKFPSLIKEEMKSAYSEAEKPIRFGDKGYYVGKEALKFGKRTVPLLSIDELIRFIPLFLKYLEKKQGIKGKYVVSGLPPAFLKEKKEEMIEAISEGWNIPKENIVVLPQGTGILFSVEEKLGDTAFVLDMFKFH